MLSSHVLIGVGNGRPAYSVNLGPRHPGFQIASGRGKGCKDIDYYPASTKADRQFRLSSGHFVPLNSGGRPYMVRVYSSLYVSLEPFET